MSWDCSHPECQDYGFCQKPPFMVDPDKAQGSPGPQPQQEDSDVIEKIPESTHQDDALDTLVSRASIPNLGALIKQGIKQGLIAPTATYN